MIIKSDLIHTVCIISADDGKTRHIGTGCLVSYKKNNIIYYALVSNKHIVKECKHFELSIPVIDLKSNKRIPSMKCDFVTAPAGVPLYDIGAISLSPLIDKLKDDGYVPDVKFVAEDDIVSKRNIHMFGDIEDVLMIGYPYGISYESEQYPIVKSGITATSIHRQFDNKDEFLVDIMNFKGSSGSPVFIKKDSGYYLAGINRNSMDDNNKVVLSETNEFNMKVNIGLSVTVKADKIITLF